MLTQRLVLSLIVEWIRTIASYHRQNDHWTWSKTLETPALKRVNPKIVDGGTIFKQASEKSLRCFITPARYYFVISIDVLEIPDNNSVFDHRDLVWRMFIVLCNLAAIFIVFVSTSIGDMGDKKGISCYFSLSVFGSSWMTWYISILEKWWWPFCWLCLFVGEPSKMMFWTVLTGRYGSV